MLNGWTGWGPARRHRARKLLAPDIVPIKQPRRRQCQQMVEYLPLVLLFALAFVFAFASFVASGILGPRKPTAAKEAPYECGIVPTREPSERFPVRFYLV